MDIEDAADEMLCAIAGQKLSAGRVDEGNTASHAVWMLEIIRGGYVQHEKGHRWLGYAQGLLVAHGAITLDQAKRINKIT